MSDFPESVLGQPILDKHYDDLDNLNKVGDRFEVYNHSEPKIDIHDAQVRVLGELGKLTTGALVVEPGSSKADMYARAVRAGHHISYVGIDRNANQFNLAKRKVLFVSQDTLLIKGSAESLPLQDASADVTLLNFVLYHLNSEQRTRAFQEVDRVTKPDGLFVASTSSILNKSSQRQLELRLGDDIGAVAPPAMNRGFTSESAEGELHEHFPDWCFYRFDHRGYFTAADETRIAVSANSIRSARDLYSPIPSVEHFEAGLAKIVTDLRQRAQDGHPMIDHVDRSFWIISRKALDLPIRTLLK